MKFSPKCRELRYTILGSFSSFLNWEGAIFGPKSGLGKCLHLLPILGVLGGIFSNFNRTFGKQTVKLCPIKRILGLYGLKIQT